MIYSVKARYIEKKMGEFYQKLTDGTIQNQKPDGQEIINSMKRAKITEPNAITKSLVSFNLHLIRTAKDPLSLIIT